MVLVEMSERSVVPEHNHPHEQMSVFLKRSADFESDSGVNRVKEGETYFIAGNGKHKVSNPSKGGATFLEIFSPPRENYLAKAGG